MGISLSWIALEGLSVEDAAARAGLTFEPVKKASRRGSRFWVGALDGWSVIVAEDYDYPSRARLAHLSRGSTALGVQVEEHAMVSTLQLWREGERTWALLHDPDRPEAENHAHEGQPPAPFDRLRRRAFARQRGSDGVDHLFSLPSDLSEALCGFDPNELAWDEDERFRLAYRALGPRDGLDGDTAVEWRAFAADKTPRTPRKPREAPKVAVIERPILPDDLSAPHLPRRVKVWGHLAQLGMLPAFSGCGLGAIVMSSNLPVGWSPILSNVLIFLPVLAFVGALLWIRVSYSVVAQLLVMAALAPLAIMAFGDNPGVLAAVAALAVPTALVGLVASIRLRAICEPRPWR